MKYRKYWQIKIKEMSLVGTVIYCYTSYHRGPNFYYIVRESKASVWVKGCKTITENSHGDGTYHSETVVGVEAGDGVKEYCLRKRQYKSGECKQEYMDLCGGVYFVGKLEFNCSETFDVWDGTPKERTSYY